MKRFSNILVVADGGGSSGALRRAVALAKNNQASITLVGVVDSVPGDLQLAITAVTPAELGAIAVKDKLAQLEEAVADVAGQGVSIEVKVLVGKSFIEIVRLVLKEGHDLVIKDARRRSRVASMLFGSEDMQVLRKCPCPVWLIKSGELTSDDRTYRRILVAVDQDAEGAGGLNRLLLELSSSLAIAESSELHVVHAWRLFAESYLRSPRLGFTDTQVDEMVAQEARSRRRWLESLRVESGAAVAEAMAYLKPQLHVVQGDPKQVVPDLARELDVDLVVMGTLARTGIAGMFMGNTAETILGQLDCSVLAVKPAGFVSPVAPG